MACIVFDCLVPTADSDTVKSRFERAVRLLDERGRLVGGVVSMDPHPTVDPDLEEQLHRIFREEHDDLDMDAAAVYRYRIDADDVPGSLNEVAMVLSHVLTPAVELPHDAVFLEIDGNYEVPARYPWSVWVSR